MSDAKRSTAVVLVADDDKDILDLVRVVLEEDGYEVIGATDGGQALKRAAERTPDLCVLDVMMPKFDGIEVTEKLRAEEATRDVPILLLSARTEWAAVLRGKEAGANEYLTKPFIPDDLQHEARALLSASAGDAGSVSADELVDEILETSAGDAGADGERGSAVVLVAATDENVINLVRYRLELDGYEVIVAEDADDAKRIAEDRSVDLCVLDASMEPPDGVPVARVDRVFDVQQLFDKIQEMLGRQAKQSRTA
jgi:DNA-binding response OmpR family regulator